MSRTCYLACDLGAESGRVILGILEDGRLTLEEAARFPTGLVQAGSSLCWNVPAIFQALKRGLSSAAARLKAEGLEAASLSVDSWGVDYVLVDASNTPLALPFHYRDPRTEAAFAAALSQVPADTIFAETGIQFMPINTLYQLLAHSPSELAQADHFLLIADCFHALLCGIGVAERSLASTTQLYNPVTADWSETVISGFRLPKALFPPLVDSGTALGVLMPEIAAQTGLRPDVKVLATCSHDTGAAVAAVPEEGDDWAFLSSGTWSLLGVELPVPLMSAEAMAANFTNEVGYGGRVRFLKNIAGLWIVQECRRTWLADGRDYSYGELTRMAEAAPPFCSVIQPADARFLSPGGMPEKVRRFCRETEQAVPATPGQVVRCALESLALSYRQTLEQVEGLTGRTVRRLHIVGGGCRNALLCQFAANATGRVVVAGPVEATAVGNVLLQAVTLGDIGTAEELRRTVCHSFPLETYLPSDTAAWDTAYTNFQCMERLR